MAASRKAKNGGHTSPTPKAMKGATKEMNEKEAKESKDEATEAGGTPKWMMWGCLLMGVASMFAGIVTPPLESFRKEYIDRTRKQAKAQTRKDRSLSSSSSQASCNEESLAQFLHDEPAKGMHVLCFSESSKSIELYPNLFQPAQTQLVVSSSDAWDDVKSALQNTLRIQENSIRQPWAIFSNDGTSKLVTEDDTEVDTRIMLRKLRNAGMVLLMEGGVWIWPGVRIGFRRTIDLSSVPGKDVALETRNATLETISLRPLVVSVEGFLSDEECDFIQDAATPNLKYSQVSLMDKDKGRPASDFRTSQSTFVQMAHPILEGVDYRTASLVRIPRSHQEHVQVLRYGHNEHYSAHHDYFNPALYKNDPGTMRTIDNGRRNRLATVFWYLSDVEEGGETVFPLAFNAPYPTDLTDCSRGLKVKPQRGKVIIFYSMMADGSLDDTSLHGACAVKKGVKFAANKWVWNAPMSYIRNA